jgi:hypothetical protein
MPATLNIKAPGLPAFSATLVEYIRVSKKLPAQVVDEKGTNIRIRAMKEFHARAYKKGRKGGAWREQKRRFKQGKGVRVRNERGVSDNPIDKNGKPLNRWQSAVKHEMERRTRGVGVLGASIIDKRYRKIARRQGGGKRLVENKSYRGSTLGTISQTDGEYRVTMFHPGALIVNDRYGIANKAMNDEIADINVYLVRKANEAAQAALDPNKKK